MDNREAIKAKKWATLVERYGSEEAAREMLRAAQKKSRKNYSGNGGMRAMSPEKRSEIARLGALKRWEKHEKAHQTAKGSTSDESPAPTSEAN